MHTYIHNSYTTALTIAIVCVCKCILLQKAPLIALCGSCVSNDPGLDLRVEHT